MKKILKPSRRRPVVHYLCGAYRVSQRRACRTAVIAESTLRYKSRQEPRTDLRLRIREIAQVRVRYGYRKILVLLKREGWNVGLMVKVYNQGSYTGGIQGLGGHLPEGWKCVLDLSRSDGSPLISLSVAEDVPADNGPHHGKLFTVITLQLIIDEKTGLVSVANAHPEVWKHEGWISKKQIHIQEESSCDC